MPLFNVTHPSFQPHYNSNQVQPATPVTNEAPQRPRVRVDFGQPQAAPVVSSIPAQLTTYAVDGYFATIRAALVANALQQGAWEVNGLPRYLAGQLPTAEDAAPTQAANAADYQAHLTMSYLPAQTEASEEAFQSLNDPTKRPSTMASMAATLAGGASAALGQTQDNVSPSNLPLIPFKPSPPPWGYGLCNQSQFPVNIGTAQNPVLAQASNVPGFVAQ